MDLMNPHFTPSIPIYKTQVTNYVYFFYKIQFIMFLVLIIFILEIPLINRRERMYWQTIRIKINIIDKDNFGKKL